MLGFVGGSRALDVFDEAVLVGKVSKIDFVGAQVAATLDPLDPDRAVVTVTAGAGVWNSPAAGVVALVTPGDQVVVGDDVAPMTTAEELTVVRVDNGVLGAELALYQDSASPAASDAVGSVAYWGNNANGNPFQYAAVRGTIVNPAAGSEAGSLTIHVLAGGTLRRGMELRPITNENDSGLMFLSAVPTFAGAPAFVYRAANDFAAGAVVFSWQDADGGGVLMNVYGGGNVECAGGPGFFGVSAPAQHANIPDPAADVGSLQTAVVAILDVIQGVGLMAGP